MIRALRELDARRRDRAHFARGWREARLHRLAARLVTPERYGPPPRPRVGIDFDALGRGHVWPPPMWVPPEPPPPSPPTRGPNR